MTTVFHPLNSVEAHLVKILLAGEGIEAEVSGDYLQGAMGELPAFGTLEVRVADEDAPRAREIIEQWQQRDENDDAWIPPELSPPDSQ